ncbi:MAG: terpene cyclase/mutase family protein [Verrucomicrobiales bacterium]|nr:terpene cyclase/mutase family protein [Verrucomicrobiales bacterium]MCP5558773.1 terpene cyclase/mutase family protein [Verrucomicrobiaceae bacterium]
MEPPYPLEDQHLPTHRLPPARRARNWGRFAFAIITALLVHLGLFQALRQIVLIVQHLGTGVEIIARPAPEAPQQEPVAQRIASAAQVPPASAPPDLVSQALAASVYSDAMPLVPFTSQWQPTDPGANLGAATPIFSGGGGMGLPQKMRARMSPESRLQLIQKNGGTPQTEDAVGRALLWLREHQNLDGSWGQHYPAAMTGLAVLCYLGHGDIPGSRQHGQVVSRGITFLTDLQARNRSKISTRPGSGQAAYEHGIATYALGEAYAMARFGQKDLGPIAEGFFEGVRLILRGQTKRGGWLYGYEQGGDGDTSVTGWQYQALKIADQTRLPSPR